MRKTATATPRQRKLSPDVLERKYKKNYLTRVIAQIQVVNPIVTIADAPHEKLAHLLRKSFSIEDHKDVQQSHITITPEGPKTSSRPGKVYTYLSPRRTKIVQITEEAMTLEYLVFKSSGPFKKDFISIIKTVFECYPDVQVNRLGMRFIDKIDLKGEANPTDWTKYLNQNLLGAFALVGEPESLVRAFHVLETKKDNVRLKFQYGMHNPDYPAPIRQKVFMLDTDVHVDGLLSLEAITDYWQTLRDTAHLWFESVITDNFRKHLGIVK